MGCFGLFVTGGPVCPDPVYLSLLETTLIEYARISGALFVQVEPLTDISWSRMPVGKHKRFTEQYTALIDLTESEETVLARMKQKGRYNIRLAERSGVTVSSVEPTEENIDTFYRIFAETLDRDGFAGNAKGYFQTLLRYLHDTDQGELILAKREGQTIAGGIFTYTGSTAVYYYGASVSSPDERRYMATYLVQWYAIQRARERGCTVYDFLGIADPGDTTSHLAGVTEFKLKLTDTTRKWPDARMYIARPLLYRMFRWARMIRKRMKRH